MMRCPDYMILGAMKCGTSTLAAQLDAQPGLFMTTPKEPCYFSDDGVFAKGPEWYADLYAQAQLGDIMGEASTHYTKRPDYPQTIARIKATGQVPRLVYMIRNPMVRLVSHYIHAWSEGWLTDPLEAALETYPRLVSYGCYGWQIEPWIEAFGRDAVLLTSLERQKTDPQGELARIAAHVGFSGPVQWQDLGVQNKGMDRVRKLPLHGLLVDHPVSAALRRAVVPKSLRTRIRMSRKIKARPEIPAHAVPGLEARFAADKEILKGFFAEDPTLDLVYPFAAKAPLSSGQ